MKNKKREETGKTKQNKKIKKKSYKKSIKKNLGKSRKTKNN